MRAIGRAARGSLCPLAHLGTDAGEYLDELLVDRFDARLGGRAQELLVGGYLELPQQHHDFIGRRDWKREGRHRGRAGGLSVGPVRPAAAREGARGSVLTTVLLPFDFGL